MNDRNHMYAEPEQESDEAWIKSVVFELTGVECGDNCGGIHAGTRYVGSQDRKLPLIDVPLIIERTRNVALLRELIAASPKWPLKDSVTGSAGTAEGNQAAQASSGAGHDKPAQPVAEAICASCHAPCTGTLCVYCSLRSSPKYVDSAVAERTDALPGQGAARERVAALERRNRPRVTADSVELAKPHPWDCDDSLVGD